jgi:hypothetical protein
VKHSHMLVAIWDGWPANGRGGTAEIVEWARSLGKPICHVWAGTAVSHEHAPVEYINFR